MGPRVPWASRQLVSPPPDLRRYCSGYLILDHHFLEFSFFRTKNPRYVNCSHFWENFRFLGVEKCRKISLKYVPLYRKIHRIRIRYSKYQFIVQHTPNTPKYVRTLRFHFLENYLIFTKVRMILGIFGLFGTINWYFEYRIRILCI